MPRGLIRRAILVFLCAVVVTYAAPYAHAEAGDEGSTDPDARVLGTVEPTMVVTENNAVHPIHGINTGRGADQLIIYTREWGTHTTTNEWGYEVAVEGGVVVEVRGYTERTPLAIPENGYVISGHGSARIWVAQNLSPGTRVELVRGGVFGMRLTDPELFAALDLTLPGMEAVRAAVEAADWSAARAAFARYLREREQPGWYFDPDDPLGGSAPGAGDITAANDALNKRFTVIGIAHTFEGEIDWAYNPTREPDSPYAANNEWTWQFNRHHFWRSLGRTYRFLHDERYAQAFVEQMTDWVEKNPPPLWADQGAGSRWRTIEAGIRMQIWGDTFLLFLPSPSFTDDAIVTMVRSMVEHARYLMTHNTGGNWLTMEMNGLYHVGVLFPEFKEAAEWRRFAAERMRAELESQVYPDGAQYELAPGYHNVALSNFVGIVRLARLAGYELPDGYMEQLEKMYDFNLYMMTPSGHLPPFNDSSSGGVQGHLWTAYQLFPDRTDFLWAAMNRSTGDEPEHTSYAFPYAGFLVQRSDWSAHARYLAFDVGPFGYGHQHEDKLTFILHAYGRPFIVDAGNYTYDSSQWRQYVISPYAHNVAFVDGLGQNRRRSSETFVSDEPADHVWVLTPEWEFAQGSYGSELEGFGPDVAWLATHRRSILYVKEGAGRDFWVMVDTFLPQDHASHTYESLFHIDAPEVEVEGLAVRTTFRAGANLGIFAASPTAEPQLNIVRGQEEPFVQGWVSDGDRTVRPVPTASYTVAGRGVQHLIYVLYPVPEGAVPEVIVAPWQPAETERGAGATVRFADGRAYRIFVPVDSAAEFTVEGAQITGPVYFERL